MWPFKSYEQKRQEKLDALVESYELEDERRERINKINLEKDEDNDKYWRDLREKVEAEKKAKIADIPEEISAREALDISKSKLEPGQISPSDKNYHAILETVRLAVANGCLEAHFSYYREMFSGEPWPSATDLERLLKLGYKWSQEVWWSERGDKQVDVGRKGILSWRDD